MDLKNHYIISGDSHVRELAGKRVPYDSIRFRWSDTGGSVRYVGSGYFRKCDLWRFPGKRKVWGRLRKRKRVQRISGKMCL